MRHLGKLLVLVLLVSATGCDGCSEGCSATEKKLAQLTETTGAVERDFAAYINDWKPAQLKALFYLGDGVRAGDNSNAILRMNNGARLKLTANSQLRFLHSLKDLENYRIELSIGEAEVLTGDEDLRLEVGGALIVIAPNSRAWLTREDDAVDLEVKVGTASIINWDGQEETAIQVMMGGAVRVELVSGAVETLHDPTGEADPEMVLSQAQEDAASPEPSVDDKNSEETENSQIGRAFLNFERADFNVAAGVSFVIHVSRPPVYVSLETPQCDGEAFVMVGSERKLWYRGTSSIIVKFPKGTTKYALFCSEEQNFGKNAAARGIVKVLHENATYRMPKIAPRSVVEADGRTYKILYQHLLPNVIFKWSRAPESTSYLVHLLTAGENEKIVKTQSPRFTFSSGKLKEGTHRLKFEAMDAKLRYSRTSTIQIRFNNAAPKVSILKPNEEGFASGDRVSIKGVSTAGWSATVQGATLSMDKQHRFTGEAEYKGVYDAIAIRLSHPKQGVHFYLRRASRGNRE